MDWINSVTASHWSARRMRSVLPFPLDSVRTKGCGNIVRNCASSSCFNVRGSCSDTENNSSKATGQMAKTAAIAAAISSRNRAKRLLQRRAGNPQYAASMKSGADGASEAVGSRSCWAWSAYIAAILVSGIAKRRGTRKRESAISVHPCRDYGGYTGTTAAARRKLTCPEPVPQRAAVEQFDFDGVFFLRLEFHHGDAAVFDIKMGHAGERPFEKQR